MGFTQWALASTRPPYLKAMAIALCGVGAPVLVVPGWLVRARDHHPVGHGRGELQQAGERPQAPDVSPEAIAAQHAARCTRASTTSHSATRSSSSPARTCRCSRPARARRARRPFWAPLDFSAMLATWDRPDPARRRLARLPVPADARRLRRAPRPAARRCGCGSARAGTSRGRRGRDDRGAARCGSTRTCAARPGCSRNAAGHASRCRARAASWRDFPNWPPPACPTPWFLHADGGLSTDAPSDRRARARTATTRPIRRRRSVASACSPVARATTASSRRATTCSCSRATCSTDPLEIDRAGARGPPRDVERSTTSTCSCASATCHPTACRSNVCDGAAAVHPRRRSRAPTTARSRRAVALWPAAYRFADGHRVRVQVASGAHPVYAREPRRRVSPSLTATRAGRQRRGRAPRRRAPERTSPLPHVPLIAEDGRPGRSPGARLPARPGTSPLCPHERADRRTGRLLRRTLQPPGRFGSCAASTS